MFPLLHCKKKALLNPIAMHVEYDNLTNEVPEVITTKITIKSCILHYDLLNRAIKKQ